MTLPFDSNQNSQQDVPPFSLAPFPRIAGLLLLLVLPLLVAWGIDQSATLSVGALFLPLHGFAAILVVVLTVLVALTGWSYQGIDGTYGSMLLTSPFLAVGLLSLTGVVFYVQPTLGEMSLAPGQVMLLMLCAHLIASVALMGVVLFPHKQDIPPRYQRYVFLGGGVVVAGLIYWLCITVFPVTVQALTNTGVMSLVSAAAMAMMMVNMTTVIILSQRSPPATGFDMREIFRAALLLGLSGGCFLLQTTLTGMLSLLGMLYAAFAYGSVYHMVSGGCSRAVARRLRQSQQQLQREQAAVQQYADRVRLIAEHARDVIFRYRLLPEPGFEYISPAITHVTGYTPEEYYADPQLEQRVIHPDDQQIYNSMLRSGDSPARLPILRRVHRNGTLCWTEQNNWPVYDNAGRLIAIEGIIRDITERKEAEEQLHYMAFYDGLTDLPNRVLFQDRLQRAIVQSRHAGQSGALLLLDIDRFRSINDTLGHAVGDRLLRVVAERLQVCVREYDTVARLGGDEFAIILTEVPSVQGVVQAVQHILTVLSSPVYLEGREIYASASIGIALYPTDTSQPDVLIQYADVALYRAKSMHRSSYAFYTDDLHRRTLETLKIENDLRKSIERADFCLYYQPRIDLANGQMVGVETLVRWQHPEQGFLLPNRFISIAEESGLIVPLGKWIINAACAQGKAWRQAGLPPLRVAVNLSAVQFARPDIVCEVAQALETSGLEPEHLELELTESMLMHDAEEVIARLYELKALGVWLSVDDFGTGYSSLSYLKRLPIDTLKIDRSFMRDVPHNADDVTIASTVIVMARSLNLHVVAEGVENEQQEAFLRDHHCDEVQGNRYGLPMRPDAIVQRLRQSRATLLMHRNGLPHQGDIKTL